MHELTIAQAILETLQDEQRKHAFERVLEVRLHADALAGIEENCLRYAFTAVSANTFAKGAVLTLSRGDWQYLCRNCKATPESRAQLAECPKCGSPAIELQGSDSFQIVSVQVE